MRNKRGFTLIELLVVIAIIAILAAILFPVFANAKKAAHRSACISNVKQIGLSLNMYVDDSGGKYPTELTGDCPPGIPSSDWDSPNPGHLATGTMYALRYHVKNKKMWMCPAGGQRAFHSDTYTVPPGRKIRNTWPEFVGWIKAPLLGTMSTNYVSQVFSFTDKLLAAEGQGPWSAAGKTPMQFYTDCKSAGVSPILLTDAYDPLDPRDPSDILEFAPHQGGSSWLKYDGSIVWRKDGRIKA